MATTFNDVIESFESSFMDKHEIPKDLELMWLHKAIGDYGVEISPLAYDDKLEIFDSDLDRYSIDVLAKSMKVYYMEREVSRTDKIVSIVGGDLSVNGQNGLQKYSHEELATMKADLIEMYMNLKPTAYN